MTFTLARQQFTKEHIWIVEIDLDYCANTYGAYPCTAEVGVTGDQKCFNTVASCQDVDNYGPSTKTYRFCTKRSPHPVGINAIPCIESVTSAPSVADLSGGLGVRASVSVSFGDLSSSDIGIDPYVNERAYAAFDVSTFFLKLRARNPYYQGRPCRVLSGYLVDGLYDAANFETRYYVIEKLNASGGQCQITAKDPLKLADSLRAQAPRPSAGQLNADLASGATSATLEPAGIGDTDYPAAGYARIRSEVVAFTRSGDALTLTRGQYNTSATDHTDGDTVQLCLEYDAETLPFIINDLLTTYAEVDPAYIPLPTWESECATFLPGLLSALITTPTGIATLLKELGDNAPHSLFWNERTGFIELVAIKPPPIDATPFNDSDNLIELETRDELAMRVSSVVVYFGMFDPTKKLEEPDNYRQIHARIDAQSAINYGTPQIKTIYSRWITNLNKAAAVLLASRIGRRFATAPRSATFAIDPKDLLVWTGDSIGILSRNVVGFTGEPELTTFQITSAKEGDGQYEYTALEYDYADPFDEDPEDGVKLILFGGDLVDVNLRSVYDSLYPTPVYGDEVLFIVESAATIGCSFVTEPAMRTGAWPAGVLVKLEVRGQILGRGGRGGTGTSLPNIDGQDGGWALTLDNDLTLNNLGVIGGGGGGGGGAWIGDGSSLNALAQGGGGAGSPNVALGGTDLLGGAGQTAATWTGELEYAEAIAGDGGDCGEVGGDGSTSGGYPNEVGTGGAAGAAIKLQGYTITYEAAGTILGAIEA